MGRREARETGTAGSRWTTRRGGLVRIAVAVAVAAAGAPVSGSSAAAPAAGPKAKAFTWTGGDCKEVGVEVALPTAKLQRLLPAGYTVREELPGTGDLLLGMAECASLEVEGVEQPRDSSADAVIPVVDRSGAAVMYHLWQVTGAPALRKRMQALGFRGELSSKAAATSTLTPAAGTGEADVPWSFAPYSVTAAGAKVPFPASGTASWVQVTRRGTVETAFQYEDYEMHLGVGRLTVPAESWLAKLLGSTTYEGSGFLSEPFDFTARVTLRKR